MAYPLFDRSQLKIQPLALRQNDLDKSCLVPLDTPPKDGLDPAIPRIGQWLEHARRKNRSRLWVMGAHVIRAGVVPHLIDLMDSGHITGIALNGAGPIHDWEFALIGASTESVARYIRTGEFGLWTETGRINEVVKKAAKEGIGIGEALGREILEGDFPNKEISLLAQAYKRRIPVTVHVGIGQDILHEHPTCDGAAFGAASYTDFLVFTRLVQDLEEGALLNLGSAVMGPEVYLKALAMARNVALQKGAKIANFCTAVFDLMALGNDWKAQAPKSDPRYYYRPWKTILVRTVADGGESHYVQGDHRDTVVGIRHAAQAAKKDPAPPLGGGVE